jgi:hypothetical protein
MEFVYPGMLFGLFALALPVVIHLFNFRRHKSEYFSNIELLRNIQQQTKKTNKLKHIVVLLLRMLLIACLVFAFAQPFLPSDNRPVSNAQKLVSLYIDNSKSMQAQGEGSSLFDEARQAARQLVSASGKEARFIISDNTFEPKNNFTVNAQEAVIDIDAMTNDAPPTGFSQVIRHNKNLKETNDYENRVLYYFSDFQMSIFNQNDIEPDTGLNVVLVHSKSLAKNNVFIDSCWFLSPVVQAGFVTDLVVRITNAGTEDIVSLPLQLTINDIQKSVSNVDVKAGKSGEFIVQFNVDKPGYFRGLLSIKDFPIVFDDDLFFSFSIAQQISVLEIDQTYQNFWLKTLFEQDKLFNYDARNVKQIDFQSLNNYDLIILNELSGISGMLSQSIKAFLQQGGNLIVLPNQISNLESNKLYAEFGFQYQPVADTSNTRVYKLNDTHTVFRDVFVSIPENADYPIVTKYFPLQVQTESSVFTLMELLGGNAFLLGNQYGLGQVFAFAVPLHEKWSNFFQNNLFVPVMYKLSFVNTSKKGLYTILGQSDSYQLKTNISNDRPVIITSLDKGFEMIPESRFSENTSSLFFHGMIPSPGFYDIRNGDSLLGTIAFNENRKESLLEYYDKSELEKLLPAKKFKSISIITNSRSEMQDVIKNSEIGRQLWKYFIILALFFILAEGLVLRFWK